jgi:hypothetical protein
VISGCVRSVQTLPAPQRAKHELWQPSVPKDYGRLVLVGEESIPPEQQNIPVNGGRRGKSPGHGDVSAQISRQPCNQLTHSFHAINPSARKSSLTQFSYFSRGKEKPFCPKIIILRVRKTHTFLCAYGDKPRKTHLLYYINKYQAAKCDRERFFVPNNPHFWLAHTHTQTHLDAKRGLNSSQRVNASTCKWVIIFY